MVIYINHYFGGNPREFNKQALFYPGMTPEDS